MAVKGAQKVNVSRVPADWRVIHARVVGVTPLLMHNPRHSMVTGDVKVAARKTVPTPEDEAERGLYKHPDGWLYVGADHLREAIKRAAKGLRTQGSRKPILPLIAAGLFIVDEHFQLTREGKPITTYDRIDIRRAVVQKQGILRARPVVGLPWEFEAVYQYDHSILPPELIVQALSEAGMRVGLLDYRPEKGGQFGRFYVADAWVEEA
jgi:hypothetical protein